jgi:hypothetical protein
VNVKGGLHGRFKWPKKKKSSTQKISHRINFGVFFILLLSTTRYLCIMLHNVCIVFFQIELRQQHFRQQGVPSRFCQFSGSGAGRCTLLDMAPSALLARKLRGWTPQNYSKTTHMKTKSAEETLSHHAVK